MKTTIRKHLLYIALSVITVVVVCAYGIHMIFKEARNSIRQSTPDSLKTSDKRYALYDTELQPKSVFKSATYSKVREPIEQFTNKDYRFFIYRLPTTSDKPLGKIINTQFVGADWSNKGIYYDLTDDHSYYSLLYKINKPKPGNSIYFTLSGDDIKLLQKNDSVYCYTALYENFSIKYNKPDTADFLGKIRPNTPYEKYPIEIIFKKKKTHIYLMIGINDSYKFYPH